MKEGASDDQLAEKKLEFASCRDIEVAAAKGSVC
jgi:hypothetical protein